MKLILTAKVDKLGEPGDVVEVRDGYGRNFLLPQGLAILATRGAQKQVDGIRRAQQVRQVRDLEHAQEIKKALEGLSGLAIPVRTAASGKLFGSVTAADVAQAVRAASGPVLERRAIEFPEGHIKAAGSYPVVVDVHPQVRARLSIRIVPTDD